MGVTIKEIARMLGVTAATVSRALNGKPGVGARQRKRIEAGSDERMARKGEAGRPTAGAFKAAAKTAKKPKKKK